MALVSVGWVLAADVWDEELLAAYELAREQVLDVLRAQFPEFEWEMPFVERRVYVPLGALDPLPLLELGAEEKIYRRWDYAVVVVPNELNPRHRIFTIGIPSTALEVAVVSSARLGRGDALVERLGGLVLHMLGHLWGVEHTLEGPTRPADFPELLRIEPFPEEAREAIIRHLREVADARLEEQGPHRGWLTFYVRTFLTDPRGILEDVWNCAPWELPLYLGRLTAAAAVSTIFFLMTAEAWEIGAHLPFSLIAWGAVISVLMATGLLFFGQNLGQITREHGLREQVARTQLVLFGTILMGMLFLWVVIYLISLGVSYLMPQGVVTEWAGVPSPVHLPLTQYAAFMASVGVVAAALGGNLEEEEDIKAEVLFDEEA
ncbi:MAG: hypothetical protein GXO55_04335 [Chloroflexi bacterium]|nr:hypothetical protein [Chloroflexota bacterium]